MSLIEKVASLQELEKKSRSDPVEHKEYFKYCMAKGAHDLLEVLAGFRPGDAKILRLFVLFLKHFKPDGHLTDTGEGSDITTREASDCMARMTEMACLMEASSK